MAYVKNTWATGDKITAAKMNHLEDGVAGAEGAVVSVNGQTGAVVLDANDVSAASVSALAHTNDALDALFKLTRGQAWDILADNTTACQKTIPSGTHLSVLNGWGGKSVVWNQLYNNETFLAQGGTCVTNDGVITFTASNDTPPDYYTRKIYYTADWLITGHKYLLSCFCDSDATNCSVGVTKSTIVQSRRNGTSVISIITILDNPSHQVEVYPDYSKDMTPGSTCTIKDFRLIDLTQYGASDITSIDDPRIAEIEAYALAHPEYNAGETMHGDVTSITLKSDQQTTVKTLTVPAAVRALTGYGQTGSAIAYNSGAKTWAFSYNGVATDITDLMADFENYLNEVEPGGTLTFVNSHGADYGIPVPSQIDHYRNLSEVTP